MAEVIPVTPAQAAALAQPSAPATQPAAPAAPENPAVVTPPAVPAAAPAAPAAPAQPPANSAAQPTEGEALVKMLQDAIASAKANPPVEAKPGTDATPAGGLNSLTEADISDPQVLNLGKLLQASAPGVDLDRALGKAIDAGDPKLVDSAYLKEKFPQVADQLIDIATRIVVATEAEVKSTVASIHKDAGGEPQWNAAVAAFNQHASAEIRSVIADLLNSSNHNKVKQGAAFILKFAQQGGHISTPAQLLTGAPSAGVANTDPALAPLNEKGFKDALIKLRGTPNVDPHSPEYAEMRNLLMYRRHLGKQRGV